MLLTALALLAFTFGFGDQSKQTPWLLYYSSQASEVDLRRYDPIILDPSDHPPLKNLIHTKTLYAHLNIGRLLNNSPAFTQKKISDRSMSSWVNWLIEKELPSTLANFNGIFFDGITEFKTKLEAADLNFNDTFTQIVQLIRIHFPDVPILLKDEQNIINEVGNLIHGTVEFFAMTTLDEATAGYRFLSDDARSEIVSRLQVLKAKFPSLEIFTIDFWDPSDKKTISKIYAAEEAQGFRPYVGNIGLNEIVQK